MLNSNFLKDREIHRCHLKNKKVVCTFKGSTSTFNCKTIQVVKYYYYFVLKVRMGQKNIRLITLLLRSKKGKSYI